MNALKWTSGISPTRGEILPDSNMMLLHFSGVFSSISSIYRPYDATPFLRRLFLDQQSPSAFIKSDCNVGNSVW
uniref:Uncharacterized protein n=1 Tax=Megaselia scalaris TaxID=36166 RepID=T1GPQ5_MEGSC